MSTELIQAKVERISPLTDSIIELVLTPDPFIDYLPGQYLQIRAGEDFLSYSIANASLGSHRYELHIRHNQGNPFAQPLFSQIKQQGEVSLRLPMGNCHLQRLEAQAPIIFIAGGTGFAPVKAMIEELLATGDPRPFALYWAARSQSDLYMDAMVRQWQLHVPHFQYFSMVSQGINKESLYDRIIKQHKWDLNNSQIVISGPFDMVYGTRDTLVAKGISANRLFSDAFDFEQHKE